MTFTEVKTKSVRDSNGFWTDYTWYVEENTDHHVFVFGDSELYDPEDEDWDWECDSYDEAEDWFDNYDGFNEDYCDCKEDWDCFPAEDFTEETYYGWHQQDIIDAYRFER